MSLEQCCNHRMLTHIEAGQKKNLHNFITHIMLTYTFWYVILKTNISLQKNTFNSKPENLHKCITSCSVETYNTALLRCWQIPKRSFLLWRNPKMLNFMCLNLPDKELFWSVATAMKSAEESPICIESITFPTIDS